ncbi:glycosyltransferase family 2 protein [Pararhodobacter zhoushanensis]|uniref:Glycosyltransferase n=1 Tax=Pararhodobacter zhoushanensis TaxID=2479545 RepID=A0ABT3GWE8_9RHOB|nr:glycosyltransferase family 2 protein [Pararhodobacter zhoushanensis]MCW1931830.1 glycosyltransferase [Pararhodobacter zhoushanensis]
MKISVITAVYNAEATVGAAIASVARQTHRDIEHVIVEGNSKDGSLAAIQAAAHDRMRLISEPDGGIYDALNKGIRNATGDVVGFIHSDDFLAHDGVLEQIAAAFEDPGVEAVFSDLDYVSQTDTSRVIRHWSTGPFHRERLKRGWMPAHPTLYLRRDVYDHYGTYDIKFGISADYDFILRYFSQTTQKSVYIPEVLYKMRLGGVSNRNLAKIRQKMGEDFHAIRRNRVGGISTLAMKNLSKIRQFRT